MAISGDKLYYTNCLTDTVTCCDLHGKTQWIFKDKHVLESPHGISVDNDGTCMSSVVVPTMLWLSPLMDSVIDKYCLLGMG